MMGSNKRVATRRIFVFLLLTLLVTACSGGQTTQPTINPPAPVLTEVVDLPIIYNVSSDRAELPRYESLELTVTLEAEYSNPYDVREVSLDGVFVGPDGTELNVPGFWDGEGAWRMRFTPAVEGEWTYSLTVTDARGPSLPYAGTFAVTASALHGWIIPGNAHNPDYSARYLVHHDGTPFYGVGYCEALNILIDGFDVEDGVGLFATMKDAQANYVVWWPMYTNSIVASSYDDYSLGNMKVIDAVIKDAEKEGIYLVFTVWDHPNLRDDTHAWGDGNWARNGFSKLGDLESFFVSEEAWAWQANFYRYLIARWGHSPAIGLWQTVTEINGTNAYDQTDAWHEKVNAYFVEHDPYRHPTTASGSGEVDWPTGHAVMDVPQVHLYAFNDDPIQSAEIIANWTQIMASNANKPNWVGEFGVTANNLYPELFHHALWAGLASGASMTPAEWNSGGAWSRPTPEMNADLVRLAEFVKGLPLAEWNPVDLQLTFTVSDVRGWGIAGADAGLFWVQDFSQQGRGIEAVRASTTPRTGVQVEVLGIAPGDYTVTPFDTWHGTYLDSFEVSCAEKSACLITLPEFTSDMAFKFVRK